MLLHYHATCRIHATIKVLADKLSDAKLVVRDHKSTFGTFLNGSKIDAEEDVILSDGDRLQFGAQDSLFHVSSLSYTLCSTRLDRHAKEKLKVIVSDFMFQHLIAVIFSYMNVVIYTEALQISFHTNCK